MVVGQMHHQSFLKLIRFGSRQVQPVRDVKSDYIVMMMERQLSQLWSGVGEWVRRR
jgi:hypothetical protein